MPVDITNKVLQVPLVQKKDNTAKVREQERQKEEGKRKKKREEQAPKSNKIIDIKV